MPREPVKKSEPAKASETKIYGDRYAPTTLAHLARTLPPAKGPLIPLIDVLTFAAHSWRYNPFLEHSLISFIARTDAINDNILAVQKAVGFEYFTSGIGSRGHSMLSFLAASQAALTSVPGRFYVTGSNTFIATAASSSSHLSTPNLSNQMAVDDDLEASDVEMEDVAAAAAENDKADALKENLMDIDRRLQDAEIRDELDTIMDLRPMLGQAFRSSVNCLKLTLILGGGTELKPFNKFFLTPTRLVDHAPSLAHVINMSTAKLSISNYSEHDGWLAGAKSKSPTDLPSDLSKVVLNCISSIATLHSKKTIALLNEAKKLEDLPSRYQMIRGC